MHVALLSARAWGAAWFHKLVFGDSLQTRSISGFTTSLVCLQELQKSLLSVIVEGPLGH